MTTFIPFTPSSTGPFTFEVVLDGSTYNCVISGGLFGHRYYIACYALDGTLVFSRPMVGSTAGLQIQTMDWESGTLTAVLMTPHGLAPGTTTKVSLAGSTPTTFDGTFAALVIDTMTLSMSLATDPGALVAPGAVNRDISLTAGYFNSTLVYRAPARQFEVNP